MLCIHGFTANILEQRPDDVTGYAGLPMLQLDDFNLQKDKDERQAPRYAISS